MRAKSSKQRCPALCILHKMLHLDWKNCLYKSLRTRCGQLYTFIFVDFLPTFTNDVLDWYAVCTYIQYISIKLISIYDKLRNIILKF